MRIANATVIGRCADCDGWRLQNVAYLIDDQINPIKLCREHFAARYVNDDRRASLDGWDELDHVQRTSIKHGVVWL